MAWLPKLLSRRNTLSHLPISTTQILCLQRMLSRWRSRSRLLAPVSAALRHLWLNLKVKCGEMIGLGRNGSSYQDIYNRNREGTAGAGVWEEYYNPRTATIKFTCAGKYDLLRGSKFYRGTCLPCSVMYTTKLYGHYESWTHAWGIILCTKCAIITKSRQMNAANRGPKFWVIFIGVYLFRTLAIHHRWLLKALFIALLRFSTRNLLEWKLK